MHTGPSTLLRSLKFPIIQSSTCQRSFIIIKCNQVDKDILKSKRNHNLNYVITESYSILQKQPKHQTIEIFNFKGWMPVGFEVNKIFMDIKICKGIIAKYKFIFRLQSTSMLELSRNELLFQFSESAPMFTTLTLRNTSPSSTISYKIKTTTPELFDVSPNKGILMPSQSKAVQFRTHNAVSREQAQTIIHREKFLIQYLTLNDRRSPSEIEDLWRINKNNSSFFHNIKLPLHISGIGAMDMTVPRANRMDQAAANLFMSSQNRNMELTRSPEHYNNGGSAGLLGNRMDELNRQEERLIYQRDTEFSRAARIGTGKSKLKIRLLRLLVLLLFCAVGFGIHKYIQYRKNLPRVIAKTDYTTVTAQDRVVKLGNNPQDQYNQKVLTVDTKPTTNYNGEHIVIQQSREAELRRRQQQELHQRQIEQQQRRAQEQHRLQQQERLEKERRREYEIDQQKLKEQYQRQQQIEHEKLVEYQKQQKQAQYQRQQQQAEYQKQHQQADSKTASSVRQSQNPTKVIVSAPEDAEVVINRVNSEPVRLTIIGAQDYMEGYKVDF